MDTEILAKAPVATFIFLLTIASSLLTLFVDSRLYGQFIVTWLHQGYGG